MPKAHLVGFITRNTIVFCKAISINECKNTPHGIIGIGAPFHNGCHCSIGMVTNDLVVGLAKVIDISICTFCVELFYHGLALPVCCLPVTTDLFGTKVILWRGVPLIPSDKVEVEGQYLTGRGVGTTKIILVRTGEQNQGVIGLHQSGIPGEIAPSLSARLMGLDKFGVASYLLTKYFSLAALTDDAIAVLENVEVGYYHDYQHR